MLKYVIVVVALLALATSSAVIEQLKTSVAKLNLPADRLAKYTSIFETTGKECIQKSAEGVSSEQIQTTISVLLPAFDACAEEVKNIPLDQVDERKNKLRSCISQKVSNSSLNDSQKELLKKIRACISAGVNKSQ